MMNSAAAASASAQQTDLAGSLAPGGPIGDAPSAPGGALLEQYLSLFKKKFNNFFTIFSIVNSL